MNKLLLLLAIMAGFSLVACKEDSNKDAAPVEETMDEMGEAMDEMAEEAEEGMEEMEEEYVE